MILILILAPPTLAPGGTCPHLPSPSYATAHRRVNNSLVEIVPSLHDSLTKIFNITDLCFVHHFLHALPYLIIDGIQIWAVRGPQCRIYEVRSFIRQKCNCFSSSVRWSTILLENVKFREFSNFR